MHEETARFREARSREMVSRLLQLRLRRVALNMGVLISGRAGLVSHQIASPRDARSSRLHMRDCWQDRKALAGYCAVHKAGQRRKTYRPKRSKVVGCGEHKLYGMCYSERGLIAVTRCRPISWLNEVETNSSLTSPAMPRDALGRVLHMPPEIGGRGRTDGRRRGPAWRKWESVGARATDRCAAEGRSYLLGMSWKW